MSAILIQPQAVSFTTSRKENKHVEVCYNKWVARASPRQEDRMEESRSFKGTYRNWQTVERQKVRLKFVSGLSR